uniref:Uncharacterized protein n=1 Tax=Anguilla anguilla TaxID=7936 RepID=A0A0E9Q616_ANGAN
MALDSQTSRVNIGTGEGRRGPGSNRKLRMLRTKELAAH